MSEPYIEPKDMTNDELLSAYDRATQEYRRRIYSIESPPNETWGIAQRQASLRVEIARRLEAASTNHCAPERDEYYAESSILSPEQWEEAHRTLSGLMRRAGAVYDREVFHIQASPDPAKTHEDQVREAGKLLAARVVKSYQARLVEIVTEAVERKATKQAQNPQQTKPCLTKTPSPTTRSGGNPTGPASFPS